jgi:hypothetical protein
MDDLETTRYVVVLEQGSWLVVDAYTSTVMERFEGYYTAQVYAGLCELGIAEGVRS